MPYKSQAQRRAFHAMAERGEIDKATVEEWDRESAGKRLPERVGAKKAGARAGGKAAKASARKAKRRKG